MNYDKPFKTLDEQLNILRARGLEIYDEDKGKHILLTTAQLFKIQELLITTIISLWRQ